MVEGSGRAESPDGHHHKATHDKESQKRTVDDWQFTNSTARARAAQFSGLSAGAARDTNQPASRRSTWRA
jgi:hypothetical protein